MDEPDYSSYTLEELEDVCKHIDKITFPNRAIKIQKELARRQSGIPALKQTQSDNSDSSLPPVKKGKKSARGLVLAIWPATVILSIYYGKLPSRNGMIHYSEEPGLFITCLLVFIGVGFYFYHSRDDT